VLLDTFKTAVVPQFFPADWLEEYPIVFSDFPSKVRIGYVVQMERHYSYLLQDEFNGLGISLSELHLVALENLSAMPSGRMTIAKPSDGPEGFVAADDSFAAVRILLPEVRKCFASELGGKFLMVLPHRAWCFCWSLSQPAERQAKHAAEAMEDFVNDEYRLTPDILIATADTVDLYREQTPDRQNAMRA
jgi:hypothetical protein